MSMDRELADRLAAMRDIERAFHFRFEGPLLRRGETRTARSRRRQRRAQLRPEMEAEMRERGRRAFRGPVSVNISLRGRRTNAPASVKAYLDCMEGIFYADDRAVEHLYVQASSGTPRDEEEAVVQIEPLRAYATNFDHAYSRLRGAFRGEMDVELEEEFERDELSSLEGELAWESRHGWDDLDAGEGELVEEVRVANLKRTSQLRLRSLVARHLYPHDRPGPHVLSSSPGSTESGEVDLGWAEKELPGSFWLPLSGVSDWPRMVEDEIVGHMSRWGIGRLPVDMWLGLDLAVQGDRNGGKDLDNLAHVVTGAFQCVAGMIEEDPVTSYRVYARPGNRDGVRVRLVDAKLLEAVHQEVFNSQFLRLRVDED